MKNNILRVPNSDMSEGNYTDIYTELYRIYTNYTEYTDICFPSALTPDICFPSFLTPTRNMIWAVLRREYIFYNIEGVEFHKMSEVF